MNKALKLIKKNALLSKIDLQHLKELITNGQIVIKTYRRGEEILTPQEFERSLILILSGRVNVLKSGLNQKETFINCLKENDLFGMASLFYETSEYPSKIIARKRCRLLIIPKEIVEQLLESELDFVKAYVKLLSQKIHFLNQKIRTFTGGDASEKLYLWLKMQAQENQDLILPCSMSELADVLGIGRASLYRCFKDLEDKKIIRKENNKVTFIN